MALGDARAILPGLVTRPADAAADARARGALRRWAGGFSPWVAEEAEALVLDVTGCAHLFGGEAALAARVGAEAAGLGFTVRPRPRRHARRRLGGGALHRGRAPSLRMPATPSTRRRGRRARGRGSGSWERRGPPPQAAGGIVPPGETLAGIGPLPVAALRLEPEAAERLRALGLGRIAALAALPRAAVGRRFGPEVLRRLDQALGRVPEPVSPARPEPVLALRLGFPEPIGTAEDVLAGLDRLLAPLAERLAEAGQGARRVRLTLVRTDGTALVREAGLARAADRPEAIRPLLALQLDAIDAGLGIETMRLEATEVERVSPRQRRSQLAVAAAEEDEAGLADLIGRIGARLGLEALTRLHPADSHIPEKGATEMAAAFAGPARHWPPPATPRPIVVFPPEPLGPAADGPPPGHFVWRRRARRSAAVFGPERITPEWWLDDPAWRSGPRDYWRVETEEGDRLWLFEAKGGEMPGGWFAQGLFA